MTSSKMIILIKNIQPFITKDKIKTILEKQGINITHVDYKFIDEETNKYDVYDVYVHLEYNKNDENKNNKIIQQIVNDKNGCIFNFMYCNLVNSWKCLKYEDDCKLEYNFNIEKPKLIRSTCAPSMDTPLDTPFGQLMSTMSAI